jgi:hypothetical protein
VLREHYGTLGALIRDRSGGASTFTTSLRPSGFVLPLTGNGPKGDVPPRSSALRPRPIPKCREGVCLGSRFSEASGFPRLEPDGPIPACSNDAGGPTRADPSG